MAPGIRSLGGIPSTADPATGALLSRIKEVVETLTGQRGAGAINLGTVNGTSLQSYNLADLTNAVNGLSGRTVYASAYSDFHAALDQIGATDETVLVISTEQFVTSNDEITSNIHPWIIGDGKLNISSGVVLTWTGTPGVPLPMRQIFYGSGTVSFSAGSILAVYPEWWGAVRNGTIDCTAAIQRAIDSSSGPVTLQLSPGTYRTISTIYLRRNGVRIVGAGPAVTSVQFVNASGGIVFAGDTGIYNSTNTYADCALEKFEVLSSAPSTDAHIIVDLTSFSYGHFSIKAQTKRPNGVIYYGQGNAGTSPYYNVIEAAALGGGADYTQTCFQFRGGAWAGGSNGPNANIIGPIGRALAFGRVFDIRVGQGNLIADVGAESIAESFAVLGGASAADTGTATSANGITLTDDTKAWTTNQWVNGAVSITRGTGSGQVRRITGNTAMGITITEAWATIPNNTSAYSLWPCKAGGNKFVNIRQEGSPSSNFISAYGDSDETEVSQAVVQSVNNLVYDVSCSPSNKLFGGTKTLITYTFTSPGASANTNAWPRSGAVGGYNMAGRYAVEWVRVQCQQASHGDTATVTLDCGGASVGAGSPTFAVFVANNEAQGSAFPSATRALKSGSNNSLFLNLKTGAAFAANISITVTVCVSMM